VSDIIWADPPEVERKKPRADPVLGNFAAQLRENPGRWAIYPKPTQAPGTTAWHINHGRLKVFGQGFEATRRADTLYVRYVGEVAS
jgi:hypothetical protein